MSPGTDLPSQRTSAQASERRTHPSVETPRLDSGLPSCADVHACAPPSALAQARRHGPRRVAEWDPGLDLLDQRTLHELFFSEHPRRLNPSQQTKRQKQRATQGQRQRVSFSIEQPNGDKRPVLVLQESWKTELPSGEVQVSRTQVRVS